MNDFVATDAVGRSDESVGYNAQMLLDLHPESSLFVHFTQCSFRYCFTAVRSTLRKAPLTGVVPATKYGFDHTGFGSIDNPTCGHLMLNMFLIAIEVQVTQDPEGVISTNALWTVAAINWAVTIAAVVVMANILGQPRLKRAAPVPSPLANMDAEAD